MLKGILTVLFVVALVVGGWYCYTHYIKGDTVSNGDVTPRDKPVEKDRTDAAFTNLDNEPQTTTYDRNAPPAQGTGATTNQPPLDQKAAAGSGTLMTAPAAVPQNQMTAPATAPMAALPVSDTIAPNPPNGAVFTGTGKYQWYRQGNITWRVNSGNGAVCIAFATMDEWQKALVYSHGCGNA